MMFRSHPRIREEKVDVWLVESPQFLILKRQSDDRDIEHIAWDNITDIGRGRVEKKGLASLFAFGGNNSLLYVGAVVRYFDDEYERDLGVFLKAGSEHAADRLVRLLWDKRDQYISASGRRTNIRR